MLRLIQTVQRLCRLEAPARPVSVACGGFHTVVVTTDGALYACGSNEDGALGLEHREKQDMLQRLDRNGTGSISRQEMQRGLTGMGIRLTPSEISAVMRAFDVNNDGTVAWHEFYRVLDTWERSGGGAASVAPLGRHSVEPPAAASF